MGAQPPRSVVSGSRYRSGSDTLAGLHKPAGLRVGLVASHRMRSVFPEAVAAALTAEGLAPEIHADGSTEVMDCDSLILMGSLGSLRRTAAMLKRQAGERPQVIAWVSEPLPPPQLSIRALHFGRRFTATALGVVHGKLPLHILTWPIFALFHRFALSRQTRGDIDVGNLRFTIENAAMISLGVEHGWIDRIAVSTEQKREALAGWGIDAAFVPVGQQESFGRDLGSERDIDVLFIGRLKNTMRARKFRRLRTQLQKLGLRVEVPSAPIFGDPRTRLVNRAKIMLHLHNYPWDTPWMRWNLAVANGALVVSEPLSVPAPMVPGRHYVEAPLSRLAGVIVDVIDDELRRKQLVEECRALLGGAMSLGASAQKLAAMIRASSQTKGGAS